MIPTPQPTPEPTISVSDLRTCCGWPAGDCAGRSPDQRCPYCQAADTIEALHSALTQAEQARDEARQVRDKHLQAIGPAYQAGFVQGQRDLLARVREMVDAEIEKYEVHPLLIEGISKGLDRIADPPPSDQPCPIGSIRSHSATLQERP